MKRGELFSLLHCVEGTAVCVNKRESSETEAVEREHERDFSTRFSNFLAAFFSITSLGICSVQRAADKQRIHFTVDSSINEDKTAFTIGLPTVPY